MKKKYNPYAFLLGCSIIMWLVDSTYASLVIIFMYIPCLIFFIELWGKAKLTSNLFWTSTTVMLFAIGAQIIGLNTVWKLPEQQFLFNDWILFPLEELGYWHAAMLITVLTYKHLEVYHDDLVIYMRFRINSFVNWFIQHSSYRIDANKQFSRIALTSVIFASYMFIVENYSIINGFFKYFDNQITFYIWKVPFEGFMMYFLVPPFFFTIWNIFDKIKHRCKI
jgi:hypothetical protein